MVSRRPPATPVEVKAAIKPPPRVKKSARRAAVSAKKEPQALISATALPAVSAEERHAMIARAAYLRSERRGFAPGSEAEDWLAAEKEIDARLSLGYRADQ